MGVGASVVFRNDSHGTCSVVASEQIQHGVSRWLGVVAQQTVEGLIESTRVRMALSEMGEERFLEAVVHYGVELITWFAALRLQFWKLAEYFSNALGPLLAECSKVSIALFKPTTQGYFETVSFVAHKINGHTYRQIASHG